MDKPEEIPEVTEKAEAPEKKLPVPESVPVRLLLGLVVVFLPIAAFTFSFILAPEWQSGKIEAYPGLMLSAEAAWPFFPLIAFLVLSLILLLSSPLRYASTYVVRNLPVRTSAPRFQNPYRKEVRLITRL